jgi:hypothetical protein
MARELSNLIDHPKSNLRIAFGRLFFLWRNHRIALRDRKILLRMNDSGLRDMGLRTNRASRVDTHGPRAGFEPW